MTDILLHPTDCASITSNCIVRGFDGEAGKEKLVLRQQWQMGEKTVYEGMFILDQGCVFSAVQTIYPHSSTMTQGEQEFYEQKEAYLAIPPLILAPYKGQYVVVHNGEILDSDSDLPTLTGRFFAEHEDMPIYVTKVGEEIAATIDTPFLD